MIKSDVKTQILFKEVSDWIKTNDRKPRDTYILVKQNLSSYAGRPIEYCDAYGINARDKSKFQDILTQNVCPYITNTLHLIIKKRPRDASKLLLCEIHISY